MFLTSAIPTYLIVVNIYLFGLMAYDKRQAIKKAWRIPEWNLLLMGIVGGGIGGLLAQKVCHHKTKKKKFYVCFGLGSVIASVLLISIL